VSDLDLVAMPNSESKLHELLARRSHVGILPARRA
jgi:hypothetical protein